MLTAEMKTEQYICSLGILFSLGVKAKVSTQQQLVWDWRQVIYLGN
jgi:hypothetical protein